jgi:hypothetical protein
MMAAGFYASGESLPATGGRIHVPSDTTVIEPLTRAILTATSGAVAVEYADGTQHVIGDMASGVMHPMQVRKILATGTAATGIRVFF